MGFASDAQGEAFSESVGPFETMLARDGIRLRKYYLDISKKEQARRLEARREDPLTQWKISPIDEAAQQHWKDYGKARDAMFARTSHDAAPWHIVKADVKKIARLELIRDLLAGFDYPKRSKKLARPDRKVVFRWSRDAARKLAA